MESFRAAIIAVCTLSAGICLADNMTSGTTLGGQLRSVLRLIMAIVIIAPFAGGTASMELPQTDDYILEYNGSEGMYIDELERQTAENVGEVLAQQLTAAGISFGEITVEVNISVDMSISINRVRIRTEQRAETEEVIRSSLGCETEVSYEAD